MGRKKIFCSPNESWDPSQFAHDSKEESIVLTFLPKTAKVLLQIRQCPCLKLAVALLNVSLKCNQKLLNVANWKKRELDAQGQVGFTTDPLQKLPMGL